MVNKIKGFTFFVLIFNFQLMFAQVQIGPKQEYSSREFIQTIEWNKDKYAMEYEVEIQDENFKTVFLKRTKDSFVKFSLKNGKYRYRIFVFDLFGKRTESLQWQDLDIIKVEKPYIFDFENKNIFLSKGNPLIISAKMTGINKNSKIKIVQFDRKKSYDALLVSSEEDKILMDGSYFCKFEIPANDFSEGKYFFYVENPGDVIFEGAVFQLQYVLKPVILNFEPNVFNVLEGSIIEIKMLVQNFDSSSKVFVISEDGKKKLCQVKSNQSDDLVNNVCFLYNAVKEGKYSISIENEYGFSDQIDGLVINFSKQPRITKVSDGFFHVKTSENFVTNFSALDLMPNSIVKLVPEDKSKKVIFAKSIEEIEMDNYTVKFSSAFLKSGSYKLEVENPGNMIDSMGNFQMSVIDGVDVNIGLGAYAGTIILLYNDSLPDYTHSTFSIGLLAQASVIPLKFDFGYFGFNIDLMTSFWKRKINSVDNKIYSGIASMQLLYQKPFLSEKLRIQLGIGGGYSVFGHSEIDSDNREFAQCPILKASVDFICYPLDFIYFDIGVNYVHLFEAENYSGLIIPQIVIGTRF